MYTYLTTATPNLTPLNNKMASLLMLKLHCATCQLVSVNHMYLQSKLSSVQSSVSRVLYQSKGLTKTTLIWYVMVSIPQLFMVGGTSGTSNSSTAHDSEGRCTILRWHLSVLDLPQRDLKEVVCTRNIVVWYVWVSGKFFMSVVSTIRSRGQYALLSVTAITLRGEAIPLYKQLSDFWASPKLGNCRSNQRAVKIS